MKAKRTCGGCSACCWAHQVPSLDKPMRTPCPHQGVRGCAIHGEHPSECEDYYCLWSLRGGADRFRPDRLGIIVSGSSNGRVQLVEVREGALKSFLGQVLERFLRKRNLHYEFAHVDGSDGLAVPRQVRRSIFDDDERLGRRRRRYLVIQ